MIRSLVLGALLLVACKKETPSGLPPAGEWKAGPAEPTRAPEPPRAPVAPSGSDSGSAKAHQNLTAQKTEPKLLEKLPDGRSVIGPFSLVVPKEWTVKPVTSSMRAADFIVSDVSAKPGQEAELIVYYFGETGAGSIEDNLDRWLGQFQQASGKPSKDVAKIEKSKIAGEDVTTVSVTGRYVAAAMPGSSDTVDKQDQSLLASIIGSPSGPYYFKLVGAKATVAANAARFRAMLASIQIK